MGNRRNIPFKICVDVASVVFIGLFFILIPWVFLENPPKPFLSWMSLPILLLFADGIPFLFGVIWLMFRYKEKMIVFDQRHPFFSTTKFRLLVMFFAVISVCILKHMGG